MSNAKRLVRRAGRACAATLALALPLFGGTIAHADQTLLTIDVPSSGNVDITQPVLSNQVRTLRANVLLPDGYDPDVAYPVLYLLHGISDDYRAWADHTRGDVRRTLDGLPAIVVMPEGGRGFYLNWLYRQGRDWERYYFEELIPEVERRFRILPGRRHHTIAGASMGGYGALRLASQMPGYFGTAISMSGFLEVGEADASPITNFMLGGPFTVLLGPRGGGYARGHELRELRENLRHTRVLITVGNGSMDPAARDPLYSALFLGNTERFLERHSVSIRRSLALAGVPVSFKRQSGLHSWWYWRRDLRNALQTWGVFGEPAASPEDRWTYRTVAERGRAWDLGFRFAEAPASPVVLRRAGPVLEGEGTGTVAITTADGCVFTAELPFSRSLPCASG